MAGKISGWLTRHLPRRIAGLGLITSVVLVASAAAQTQSEPDAVLALGRLSVRPHTMATGTRNPSAGVYVLDLLPYDTSRAAPRVHVPPQCEGARRCPLIVKLQAENAIEKLGPMADKYGFIGLSPSLAELSGEWTAQQNVRILGATLRQVLRDFAIEPDKIAIMGHCQTGGVAERLGSWNADVFSRIISVSGIRWYPTTAVPANAKTEYFIDGDIRESRYHFIAAQELRRRGYPVKLALRFNHGSTLEGEDGWVVGSETVGHTPAPPIGPRVQSLPIRRCFSPPT